MGIDMDVPHHRTGLPAWTADPWFDRTAIVETWNVPGEPHTGGLATGTEGWETTVIEFLDDRLGAS